jgi:hypothetical protein
VTIAAGEIVDVSTRGGDCRSVTDMTDPELLDWLSRVEPALKDFQDAFDLVTGDPVIDPDSAIDEATWDEIMAIGDVLEAGAVKFERWLVNNPPPPGARELAQQWKGIADAILEARIKQRDMANETDQNDEATLARLRTIRNELGLEVQRRVTEANRVAEGVIGE